MNPYDRPFEPKPFKDLVNDFYSEIVALIIVALFLVGLGFVTWAFLDSNPVARFIICPLAATACFLWSGLLFMRTSYPEEDQSDDRGNFRRDDDPKSPTGPTDWWLG